MKKILAFLILAISAAVCVPAANAQTLQELVNVMNTETDGSMKFSVSGNDIMVSYGLSSKDAQDFKALLAMPETAEIMEAAFAEQFFESMGAEEKQVLGTVLSAYGADFIIHLYNGKWSHNIVFTAEDFMSN